MSSAAAASSPSPSDTWHTVGLVREICAKKATCRDIAGRPIVIFHTAAATAASTAQQNNEAEAGMPCTLKDGSRLWAMDRICYHMGGPLDAGDIEDVCGRPVVSCPWHRYKIGLTDGEGLYQAAPGTWKSKGKRQRVHQIKLQRKVAAATEEENEDEYEVLLLLNSDPEELSGDSYNDPERYAALQARLGKQQSNTAMYSNTPSQESGSGLGVPGGYQRSGQVFAANRAAAASSASSSTSSSKSSAHR